MRAPPARMTLAGMHPSNDQLAPPSRKETDMSADPTELTIENSALVLIDHQPMVAFQIEVDSAVLINNVTLVARSAKALGVPTS
jgi:hypothetical protein